MFKKFINLIRKPTFIFFLIVLVAFAACLAGTVLFITGVGMGTAFDAVAYILFVLSAILLGYAIFCIIYLVPVVKERILAWAQKREFTKRLFEQYSFRTIIFAIIAFAISMANAIINGVMGIVWLSVWSAALGAYYLMLSMMRGSVLLFHRKKSFYSQEQMQINSAKVYRNCGIGLIILPVALAMVVWEMFVSDSSFVHSGLLIYFSAGYTVYKVTAAIVNFVRARKGDQMTVRAIRNINLADAAVSILALQTAMFHEFSGGADLSYANAIMGGIVCAITIAIGVFMIVNGTVKLKQLKNS